MTIVNPLLEGFDDSSFKTLDSLSQEKIEAIHDMAIGVRNLWSRNAVRNVCSDVNTPDIEIQDFIESPYDHYADTYDRTKYLLGWMISHTKHNASNTLVFDSLPEWGVAVDGYDNAHYPVFGVVDNGRLLAIHDARNGIEIIVNQVKANPKKGVFNDVTFFEINDRYRGLKQIVYVKELQDGTHKAGASIIAYDFGKKQTKGRGYTVTSD
ncbi:hypothetical protein COV25_02075 [candidate division WWE3 bacterium CG10_big_fil_rev_8_21_14_0_10_35_32]|nr:MAG: hypothetical protein COV25_02075 [candidate division WWE3 bacterium CG10_big_fil_rev_8_21_14_0_10_35_32]